MKFEEALKHMRNGSSVTRASSPLILHNHEYYFIEDNKIKFYNGISIQVWDKPFYQSDLMADDWILCERVDG